VTAKEITDKAENREGRNFEGECKHGNKRGNCLWDDPRTNLQCSSELGQSVCGLSFTDVTGSECEILPLVIRFFFF